jgi:hypothetical protein
MRNFMKYLKMSNHQDTMSNQRSKFTIHMRNIIHFKRALIIYLTRRLQSTTRKHIFQSFTLKILKT